MVREIVFRNGSGGFSWRNSGRGFRNSWSRSGTEGHSCGSGIDVAHPASAQASSSIGSRRNEFIDAPSQLIAQDAELTFLRETVLDALRSFVGKVNRETADHLLARLAFFLVDRLPLLTLRNNAGVPYVGNTSGERCGNRSDEHQAND